MRHIVGGHWPVDDSFPAEGTATRATFRGYQRPRNISWVDGSRSTTLSRRRAIFWWEHPVLRGRLVRPELVVVEGPAIGGRALSTATPR
jgi:hypothetical protein